MSLLYTAIWEPNQEKHFYICLLSHFTLHMSSVLILFSFLKVLFVFSSNVVYSWASEAKKKFLWRAQPDSMLQFGWWDSTECFFSASNLGVVVDPRPKLLANPLIVNPPRSNPMHSFSPSTVRWVYKHLLVLEVRPVPVRQSCPAASQLLSLHRCL